MRYCLSFIAIFFLLFSCSSEDDTENSVFSSQYKRNLIYKDSVSEYKGEVLVKVNKQNDKYNFSFEASDQKIETITEIEMEMTGGNTLRNIDWTPSKLIMMSKDSLNINYSKGTKIWVVNGHKIDSVK